jgi:hypothetical protein
MYVRTYIHTYTYIHTHTNIYTYTHIHTRTYIHTHTHIHILTYYVPNTTQLYAPTQTILPSPQLADTQYTAALMHCTDTLINAHNYYSDITRITVSAVSDSCGTNSTVTALCTNTVSSLSQFIIH